LDGSRIQDDTWYGGRPQPRPHCVRWGPSSQQKGHSPRPIFGPCLLWPNGWMDQDATWYGGKPRPTPHCVSWDPASPPQKNGVQPPIFVLFLSWPNDQIRIPLGKEVGHGLGDIVLDGDPSAPNRKGHNNPHFSVHVYMSVVAKRSTISAAAELLVLRWHNTGP